MVQGQGLPGFLRDDLFAAAASKRSYHGNLPGEADLRRRLPCRGCSHGLQDSLRISPLQRYASQVPPICIQKVEAGERSRTAVGEPATCRGCRADPASVFEEILDEEIGVRSTHDDAHEID